MLGIILWTTDTHWLCWLLKLHSTGEPWRCIAGLEGPGGSGVLCQRKASEQHRHHDTLADAARQVMCAHRLSVVDDEQIGGDFDSCWHTRYMWCRKPKCFAWRSSSCTLESAMQLL